jgi:NAD(P)-dependent dehydrogenase (short-subunit alcohol dehydrogenase family)
MRTGTVIVLIKALVLFTKSYIMDTNNLTGNNAVENPVTQYPQPPYPEQEQDMPGTEQAMDPKPDHGENTYKGTGKLEGRAAIITGGDSGIGKAVALAFAREGADVLISYLNEHEDAKEAAKYVEEAGRKAILLPGDISDEKHCQQIVERAVQEFGRLDILVNNAAYQMDHESLQDVTAEEWDYTFKTNIHAMFYLCKAAEPHLKPGSSVINTTSVNAYTPKPTLAPYTATKAAIQNFTATLTADKTAEFGSQTPMKRAGQPAELAPAYVLLASPESSYMSGATVPVTGGMPTI